MNPEEVSRELFSAAGRASPHGIYARLRQATPVCQIIAPHFGVPLWMATRHDDCLALLRDPRFTNDVEKLASHGRQTSPLLGDPALQISRHMLTSDPPDHTRLRAFVQRAFSPRIVEGMRSHIEAISDALLDEIEGQGGMDLIADFAFLLPIAVIAELLGVPYAERERFRAWTKILAAPAATPEDLERRAAAVSEFATYFHSVFEERRAAPGDDLLSALVAAEDQGDDRLTTKELLSMTFLLLVAGHETSANLIGNGTLTLLEHPSELAKLRERPEIIGLVVEEVLRYESPVETTSMRWALTDVELRGARIRAGEPIVAGILAANRDPEQFVDPDTFDITRQPNRHVAFGYGVHACLGAPLARMEGAIALGALFRRFPRLALTASSRELEWNQSHLLRGVRALPVVF
ncbi:cytochrome P450 family protein [Sorangium sp. So ce426]|uniref:cytochrome P450 family protein n=1 Tax=unclassified Sorangium TaxID=2621164 RepID=UPI003F5BC691